jgi:hydrogenase maturation protein HypF
MAGASALKVPAAGPVATEIRLPRRLPDTLALGAFLKVAVCAVRGDRAFVSHPVGDLASGDDVRRFDGMVADMLTATGVRPTVIAHDLHPDFATTRRAEAMGLPTFAVQHHHAHVAAVAAEHGLADPVVGLALDGFGLGPGNEAWGGELLWVDGSRWRRLGHLRPLVQPGGDVAARQPWRMAAAALHALGRAEEISGRFVGQPHAGHLAEVLARGVNCPPTTSCGRLFDAACGLLGVHPVVEFEGQAPMALERMVRVPRVLEGGWRIGADGVLDLLPLLGRLPGLGPAEGAEFFHGTLVAALAEWAAGAAQAEGISAVVLGGGCFLNRVLSNGLAAALAERGLKALPALRLSPGDAGLSLGQAWVAGLTHLEGLE